jgi:hypothetical protein
VGIRACLQTLHFWANNPKKHSYKKILSEPITQRITPESLGQFFANSDNSYEDFDDFTGINRRKSLKSGGSRRFTRDRILKF